MIFLSVLPGPCKPSLPLLAKTRATWGHFKVTKFFIPAPIHSHISGFISCPFLKLFHTDPAVAGNFAVEVVPCPAAGILALVNIPAVACFPAVAGVSDCIHAHFHWHRYSTNIQLLKLPHFWKVAVTTAIWHRWFFYREERCNLWIFV